MRKAALEEGLGAVGGQETGGTQDICPWACTGALEDSNNFTLWQKMCFQYKCHKRSFLSFPLWGMGCASWVV